MQKPTPLLSHEELIGQFGEWVKADVLEYLNRQLDLKAIEERVSSKTKLSVLDCFSLLKQKWFDTTYLPFILHPKLASQNTTHHCGFHAFYNTVCFLHILLSSDPSVQLKYAHRLFSKFSFWLFYKRTIEGMVKELKAAGKTSDIENLVNDGPLERYEMQHLVESHPKIAKLLAKYSGHFLKFTRLFFSFSNLIAERV